MSIITYLLCSIISYTFIRAENFAALHGLLTRTVHVDDSVKKEEESGDAEEGAAAAAAADDDEGQLTDFILGAFNNISTLHLDDKEEEEEEEEEEGEEDEGSAAVAAAILRFGHNDVRCKRVVAAVAARRAQRTVGIDAEALAAATWQTVNEAMDVRGRLSRTRCDAALPAAIALYHGSLPLPKTAATPAPTATAIAAAVSLLSPTAAPWSSETGAGGAGGGEGAAAGDETAEGESGISVDSCSSDGGRGSWSTSNGGVNVNVDGGRPRTRAGVDELYNSFTHTMFVVNAEDHLRARVEPYGAHIESCVQSLHDACWFVQLSYYFLSFLPSLL